MAVVRPSMLTPVAPSRCRCLRSKLRYFFRSYEKCVSSDFFVFPFKKSSFQGIFCWRAICSSQGTLLSFERLSVSFNSESGCSQQFVCVTSLEGQINLRINRTSSEVHLSSDCLYEFFFFRRATFLVIHQKCFTSIAMESKCSSLFLKCRLLNTLGIV